MTRRLCLLAGGALSFAVLAACHEEAKHEVAPPPVQAAETVAVEPRIQLLPTYPCSDCHKDLKPRPERHRLEEFHSVRNDEFSHGADEFWCYQCHSDKNIDRLHTATGELVTFNEAYKICVSCHGDKLEDWRSGLHGLVVGDWNGKKLKKSCPACHDPHDPRYQTMEPMPPPAPVRKMTL